MATGKITAIRGVVIDVEFPEGQLPEIYEALTLEAPQGELVLEVQQHLGGGSVRTVSTWPSGPMRSAVSGSSWAKASSAPDAWRTLRISSQCPNSITSMRVTSSQKKLSPRSSRTAARL